MKHLTACAHCDCLLNTPILNHNECAFCPRCQHRISHRPKYSLQFTLSFAIACLVLFGLSNAFVFLSIDAQGQSNDMLLWRSSIEFWLYDQKLLAVLIFIFILLVPFIVLISLVYMLFPMIFMRRVAPATAQIARYIFKLKNWSMIDVYLVAVLASLTKLTALANIELGLGMWAYICFSICLSAALSNLDRFRFWRYLDKIKCHQKLKLQHPNN